MKRMTLTLVALTLAPGCSQDRDVESSSGADTESGTNGTPTGSPTSSTAPGDSEATDSGAPGTATSSATTTAETSSGSDTRSSSAAGGCEDLDLGTTIGPGIVTGTTVGRGNDYTTMSCGSANGGGGFVGPDRSDQEDFVIVWTFPATGSYVVKSAVDAEFDVVIGVAAASCDADVDNCDDECSEAETALVIAGREGEQVHLIVEGFSEAGEFSLGIFEGEDPECQQIGSSSGDGSSGGGSSTGE